MRRWRVGVHRSREPNNHAWPSSCDTGASSGTCNSIIDFAISETIAADRIGWLCWTENGQDMYVHNSECRDRGIECSDNNKSGTLLSHKDLNQLCD